MTLVTINSNHFISNDLLLRMFFTVPVWDALGEEMRPKEGVVIAQIDMTKNSITVPGVVVHGYPTIYLFKKGNKGAPVEYRGARDVASFKAFLSQHA